MDSRTVLVPPGRPGFLFGRAFAVRLRSGDAPRLPRTACALAAREDSIVIRVLGLTSRRIMA
jgi:hypothetical protein